MRKGCIQIYTGDGKGKTTASVGLAVRAVSHNLKVCFISFHKNNKRWKNGEIDILKKLGVSFFSFASDTKLFNKKITLKKLSNECIKALNLISEIFQNSTYDVLILDEINFSLCNSIIQLKDFLAILKNKPKFMELIITGRNAPKELIKIADLVTEMKLIKHYYDAGINARPGIEF